MATEFAPWTYGEARRSDDGKTITGTLVLKADAHLKLTEAQIVFDGQGLVFTFDVLEAE